MTARSSAQELVHASCVAFEGKGLLLIGPSGSGKSALALHLMSLGASLVSDDQTLIEAVDGRLVARAPDTIRGLVEARFLGLLSVPSIAQATVMAVVDLARTETERLPPERKICLAGVECSLVYGSDPSHLAHGLRCLALFGRGS